MLALQEGVPWGIWYQRATPIAVLLAAVHFKTAGGRIGTENSHQGFRVQNPVRHPSRPK